MKSIVYYLGLSALITHELDAVLNVEWRLLYHLRTLPDVTASAIFVAMHFPMFFFFLYFSNHQKPKIKTLFRTFVALFLVVHGALHFRLSDHELYQFEGVLSNLYIFSAAFFALIFLVMTWQDRGLKEA